MNWLITLFLRWWDRRRPALTLKWTSGYSAYEGYIEFGVALTNDGTMIARDVMLCGYINGKPVFEAQPFDVPCESEPVRKNIVLARPDLVDLEKRLNNRPVFYGRKFTVTARVDSNVVSIEWPHEEEPPPITADEEVAKARRGWLRGVDERLERARHQRYQNL